MTTTKLSLSNIPELYDYEDFLSAYLLLGGYALDRSIPMKVDNAGDIFEVDIISHQFLPDRDNKMLIEIKSRGWSIDDIFKVRGWMDYLGIDAGVFICQKKIEEKKFPLWQEDLKRIKISLLYNGKQDPADSKLDMNEVNGAFAIDNSVFPKGALSSIRFAFHAERCMKSKVSQHRKSTHLPGLECLWDYSNDIHDISFKSPTAVSRLHKTFEIFQKYHHLSARLDYEKIHGSFPDAMSCSNFESGRVKGYILADIDYLPVCYSLYLDHLLRMYILQCCVEYIVSPKEYKSEFEKTLQQLNYSSLSNNITTGITYLKNSNCSHFFYYPRLWQLFTYMMGGFLLDDMLTWEYELLGKVSGVPTDEVPVALGVFDVLFPLENSNWIRNIGYTNIKYLNMMPTQLLGIGANFRRSYYRDDDTEKGESYEALFKKLSGDYTCRNLLKWNQSAYNILSLSKDLIRT